MTPSREPPVLSHVADLSVEVGAPVETEGASIGKRRLIPILSGTVSGPRLNGRILPGGADFQTIRPDGVMEIHARYVIEAGNGARIYVENTGIRHAPPDVMAALAAGREVDAALVYFRTAPVFETADPAHLWLTRALFVCTGRRRSARVELTFFEVR